jgi:hypothetical protein
MWGLHRTCSSPSTSTCYLSPSLHLSQRSSHRNVRKSVSSPALSDFPLYPDCPPRCRFRLRSLYSNFICIRNWVRWEPRAHGQATGSRVFRKAPKVSGVVDHHLPRAPTKAPRILVCDSELRMRVACPLPFLSLHPPSSLLEILSLKWALLTIPRQT